MNFIENEVKVKYEAYKLTVKRWELEFKRTKTRIPSKLDIKDAPTNVRHAYRMYYKMKTDFLTQSFGDALDDDEDEGIEAMNLSQMAQANTSVSICELLDPRNSLPNIREKPEPRDRSDEFSREFEAAEHLTINDTAWSGNLNKPKYKTLEPVKPAFKKKMSLNIEPTSKPLRNPKKSLSKSKSSFSINMNPFEDDTAKETLPDLETILLEKSRSNLGADIKQSSSTLSTDIKTSFDIGWLDRNTFSASDIDLIGQTSSVSAASSFGLSNLNMKCFNSSTSLNCPALNAEVKFHGLDASDHEIVGNSDDEVEQVRLVLPIAKKRRLSEEVSTENSETVPEADLKDEGKLRKNIPEKPKRLSIKKPKVKDLEMIEEEPVVDKEDVPEDPATDHEDSPPPAMRRRRSVIKRGKEGISKITKKATKLLTRCRSSYQVAAEDEPVEPEKEEEINFLIDSDLKNFKTVPRASMKELKTTERLFDDYMRQNDTVNTATKTVRVVDAKTEAKKEALEKKVKSGTLNENYVRVNLKKKIFVRGKKAFSFSKYKKSVWKGKKAAALSGPEMDMRGCDGGVLRCHNCGGVGHFAQNCKQKGDNLLPIDAEIEEESAFPTLEEAAQMANDRKLVVHSNKPTSIPMTSNEIWKELNNSSDDETGIKGADKENNDGNTEAAGCWNAEPAVKTYIGHQIPADFLKKSGLLEMSVANKDEVFPVYELNPDGSLPPTPKEVFNALKLFGHKGFRNGQEQAIMRVLCGVSTLVTLSTGSGKSLCYQLPAYLYRKKNHCITLVISPLVSLMEDQIHGIPEFINAQCLHTNQTPKQREKTMEAIKAGLVEILLVSPEAVVSGEKSTGFGSLLRQLPPIAFACIDEAHCVSQWSHNFRPSYLMICRVLREKLGVKTVLGLTATATLQTRDSIVRHLGIPDGLKGIISDIPLPDNLVLTISLDENRDRALLALLKSERFEELRSVIIYCTRRDECERVAGFVRACIQENKVEPDEAIKNKKRKRVNWSAEAYHAGLPASRRRTIQNAFMCGDLRIVVATIAFGMGINKSDIRAVIHYNMPKSFESYVQEVGRAGRDGLPAHCHVFLEPKGSDLCELRRHIYSNSIGRHVIRKLLRRVFIPCSCSQHLKISDNPEVQKELENIDFNAFYGDTPMDVSMEAVKVLKPRNCPGHEVSFAIEETVQALDIPEENISTLLCYLELHEQRYIKVLGNAYTKCKIFSYGGPKHLKQVAKTCPPLAMAIALDLKKRSDDDQNELTALEFCVVEVAASIGWDSGVVKYQLKQLEWTTVNGARKRSSITVSYSDLGFRIRSPGDLSDEELDTALDSLEKRTSSQEKTQLIQLQIIFNSFKALSFPKFISCASKNFPVESSEKLKVTIRNYFQSNLPMDVQLDEDAETTNDKEIISDIRQMIGMYPDNNFSGRALARLFHGISSPCYPAVIWGRCKYWRAHVNVNFSRLVALGNSELVKIRRVD